MKKKMNKEQGNSIDTSDGQNHRLLSLKLKATNGAQEGFERGSSRGSGTSGYQDFLFRLGGFITPRAAV
jgi:hypothetical protein